MIYIRYRWGSLSVSISTTPTDNVYDAVHGECIPDTMSAADGLDGHIQLETVIAATPALDWSNVVVSSPYTIDGEPVKILPDNTTMTTEEIERSNRLEMTFVDPDEVNAREEELIDAIEWLLKLMPIWVKERPRQGYCPTHYGTLTYDGDLAVHNKMREIQELIKDPNRTCENCHGNGRYWFDASGTWGDCPYCTKDG